MPKRLLILALVIVILIVGGSVVGGALFAGSLLRSAGFFNPWSAAAIAESKQRGQQVVEAIESYQAANGALPDTLDQLTPDYIARIDPPTAGTRRWRYARLDSARFALAFDRNDHEYPTVYYDSKNGQWYMDD